MNNELDNLKSMWRNAAPAEPPAASARAIVNKAKAKRRSSIFFQYGNIAVLSATALVIYIFLWQLYPYHTALGKTGVIIMIGSLVLRIVIEIFSIRKWHHIQLDAHTLQNTRQTLDYYEFRKFIHGSVTYTIVIVYTLAFYCLLPEFSQQVPAWVTVLIGISYPVGAAILIRQIRKGIRREMDDITAISRLSESLQSADDTE